MNFRFKQLRAEVEAELRRIFDAHAGAPPRLLEAMKYSTFAGGKRLRSMLVIASAEAVGGDSAQTLTTAAAIELIHTYTLIHDDLPAMDNDELRRGIPTNHKKFGEATAILAGDALLTLAFESMAGSGPNGHNPPPETMMRVIDIVAKAVGATGTVGGQEVDLEYEGKEGDIEKLEYIHTRKTGAMIRVSVESGGIIGGGSDDDIAALVSYGVKIGHAFQIIDDILDVTGETEQLGKDAGSDEGNLKMTYPALIGLDESKKLADKLIREAVDSLAPLKGDTATLAAIAEYIGERKH